MRFERAPRSKLGAALPSLLSRRTPRFVTILFLSLAVAVAVAIGDPAILRQLALVSGATAILYAVLFQILRSIFRRFERDIALATLNVSAYPAFLSLISIAYKIVLNRLDGPVMVNRLLSVGLVVAIGYWSFRLLDRVIFYYLKEFTRRSEVMWDDVLLPLFEAVLPVVICIICGAFILHLFGFDLTGIWVALGGATFVVGFAVKDILANFFSGIVLLIDTPFRFGDVLKLEDGSIGMLRRIGVRVTQLYMFDSHCNIYIPNSILQGQNIVNLSRPTSYYHYSIAVQVRFERDLEALKRVMEEIVLAHPDTLGTLADKLEFSDRYFHASPQEPNLEEQRAIGQQRLKFERDVNAKLEEIDLCLASIVVTLKFAGKSGLSQEEIENVQTEYQLALESLGLAIRPHAAHAYGGQELVETQDTTGLIELTRSWYRISIRDPNLLDKDEELIPEEWERRVALLKRRAQRLYQIVARPNREETRLDDYILEFRQWLQERFKAPRNKWQEPQVLLQEIEHDDEGNAYMNFKINFFVDDVKLENGRRGDRVSSQIYQEIVRYLKKTDAEVPPPRAVRLLPQPQER